MNIGEYSVRNKVVSWLLAIILVGGGVWGVERMGKLEDPAFTIKIAKVITRYPGASAEQVQQELTYHIEDAIQRMEQVKSLKMSVSRPGVSDIQVEFKDRYRAGDFPAIYDELRRKIADVRPQLPPGAGEPMVAKSPVPRRMRAEACPSSRSTSEAARSFTPSPPACGNAGAERSSSSATARTMTATGSRRRARVWPASASPVAECSRRWLRRRRRRAKAISTDL